MATGSTVATGGATWLSGTWAVFRKDLHLELRSRYAVNMLLMFVLSSVLLIAFSIGREPIGPKTQAALLWIVILFSASIGLGRAFVAEEEQGTALLLRLHVGGSMVYAGKLLFNLILLLAVDLVATLVFALLLSVDVAQIGLLATVLALGSLGLAASTTLLAAIIARASNRGPLLPVILFPVLVPLLLSVVSGSEAALAEGGGWQAAAGDLQTLGAFAGVVLSLSFLMFDYVWED